jgi:quinol-cytochrome oxidoreductase complex cytochrome b subunit
MRDVNYGWLIRYIHANGASMFFIAVYIHLFKNLYYGSFTKPRDILWASGVIIFFLIILTGFLGYVLPWGQMSLWGATVITNLVSAIPFIGDPIVKWLWGGFAVGNPTLNRFFSLHYLIPFIIAGLVITHLILLHQVGNNNPIGVDTENDKIPFYPYCYIKDLYIFLSFGVFFSFFVFFAPNVLGHPDNYIPANPLVTPAHIVPEWYLLPFYAILRSIPSKLGGVIAMCAAIFILLTIPYTHSSEVRSTTFRPLYKIFFWLFVSDCCILLWIGQNVVEYPFIQIGQVATIYYFFFFLVIVPFIGQVESYLRRN